VSEIRKSAKFDGYVMLALAVLLIWIGGQFDNTHNWGHHRLVVSTADTKGTVFDKSVILMLQHRKHSSFGLIVNQPAKEGGYYIGGPMEQHKIYALHSTDVVFPGSAILKDIETGVLEGEEAVAKLKSAEPKPKWYIIIKGYCGWGKRQLTNELAYGTWHVVNYDEKLVRETKPELMWDAANKLPGLEQAN